MDDETLVVLLFDPEWYSATNPDVAGQDPLEHFLQIGAAQGRDPNLLFELEMVSAALSGSSGIGTDCARRFLYPRRGAWPGPWAHV